MRGKALSGIILQPSEWLPIQSDSERLLNDVCRAFQAIHPPHRALHLAGCFTILLVLENSSHSGPDPLDVQLPPS
jgi:hypothetical protein